MINPPYYDKYVDNVTTNDFLEVLKLQSSEFQQFLMTLDPDVWNYRYEKNKWSIKEILLHIIDTERVFCYRALRFARNDKTELPGFEENEYAANSNADIRTVDSLVREFEVVRKSSISMFESFNSETLQCKGIASGGEFDVEASGTIIAGHLYHHWSVIKDRYLKKAG